MESVDFRTMPRQQQPQSEMPSQAYAKYAMGSLCVIFSFRVEHPKNSLCDVLVSVMVFAFCFQVPMWLPCSPVMAQPSGFATLQPFRVYPWQAYVPPDDGL